MSPRRRGAATADDAAAGGMAPSAAASGVTTDDRAGAATAADLALCRSALYQALASGFRAPSTRMVERLATPVGAAGLVVAADLLDRTDQGHGSFAALAPLVRRLATTDTRTSVLAASYQRLFGHTARGEAPAYETEYGGDDLFRQPQEMADVAGFYAAFGLTLAPGGERVDHVSCECEFLMFLARKEALALEGTDTAMLAETRKAARLFLRDHLGRFVPSLAERVRRAEPAGFYAALATLADAIVRRECGRVDVGIGPVTLHLRTAVEDRVPMACGTCPLGDEEDDVSAE